MTRENFNIRNYYQLIWIIYWTTANRGLKVGVMATPNT
jgi:hypothetical protein